MSTNFLLAKFLEEIPDGPISAADLQAFITRELADRGNLHNFDAVTGEPNFAHRATVLYSGNVGTFAGNIAEDLGFRSQGDIRAIDNTKIGHFLEAVDTNKELSARLDITSRDVRQVLNESWENASSAFVAEGQGKLVVISGKNTQFDRVLTQIELPRVLEGSNYTEINGVDITEIKRVYQGINDPASQRAFALSVAENTFARAVQDSGLTVLESTEKHPVTGYPIRGAVEWDADTLGKLGLDDVTLTPVDRTNLVEKLSVEQLREDLVYLRAKAANIASLALKSEDVNRSWANTFSEDNTAQVQRARWTAELIALLPPDTVLPLETAEKLKVAALQYADADGLSKAGRWVNSILNDFPNYFDTVPDALGKVGKSVWGHYRAAWDDTLGLMKPNGMPVQYAAKLTGAAVGALLGVLDGVAEYKKAGGFTAEFWQWAATTAAISAVAIPVFGAAASFAMTTSPLWGTVGVFALAAGGLYLGVRFVAANLVEAFADEPDSYIYIGAKAVLDALKVFESKVFMVLQGLANFLSPAAQAGEVKSGVENLEVEEVQIVGESAVGYTYNDKKIWLFGIEDGVIIGGDENNWLLHTGYGEALGQGGDDVLIGITPEYIRAGTKIGPAPADGEEDTRRVAEKDLRLTLDGGDGDDWVIALGGTGAITRGGAGRDFLFNTSAYGQLYGDTVDGRGASDEGKEGAGCATLARPPCVDASCFWPRPCFWRRRLCS